MQCHSLFAFLCLVNFPHAGQYLYTPPPCGDYTTCGACFYINVRLEIPFQAKLVGDRLVVCDVAILQFGESLPEVLDRVDLQCLAHKRPARRFGIGVTVDIVNIANLPKKYVGIQFLNNVSNSLGHPAGGTLRIPEMVPVQ